MKTASKVLPVVWEFFRELVSLKDVLKLQTHVGYLGLLCQISVALKKNRNEKTK